MSDYTLSEWESTEAEIDGTTFYFDKLLSLIHI